jgi:TPR repeat protein
MFRQPFLCILLAISLIFSSACGVESKRGPSPTQSTFSPREIQDLENNAQKGDADAQFNLGVIYYNGQGVPQDDQKAYQWFSLAATQGTPKSSEYRDRALSKLTSAQIQSADEWIKNGLPAF